MNKKIWLSPPHMSGREQKYINEAFDLNWIAPLGPNVDGIENELASYIDIKHVAALNTGTAALHLALINLGVESGDEVLVSSFTFSASVNPIKYVGAIPVLIDSENETWNMSPVLLQKAIDDRIKVTGHKPKAIILVHLYGMPAKINDILKVAHKYNIPVVEDAAEALGSRYGDKMVGNFGDMSILSFNGNKIITGSGGGALLSNNEKYITNARFLATQARDNAHHYQHSQIGYNYRMSNIIAGICRGQLEVIDERVAQCRANYDFYFKHLNDIDGIDFLNEEAGSFSNYWLTTITIDPEKTNGVDRHKITKALADDNIESRPLWKPMHLQPVFANCAAYVDGTSERLFEIGLCLPSGSDLTDKDRLRILKVIKGLF